VVVVLGNRDRDTVVDLLAVPAGRVLVLHNAVPDPHRPDTPRPAQVEKAANHAPVILFLGQLGPRKGVPELLQALADPVMAAVSWRAVLAGDGPVETYRDKAAHLGLADRVTLTGWLDKERTRKLCEGADILVLPSHGEGMAMAVLEGLAYGLTVVTTPVGAHREVLTDGQTCVFVPVGDARTLADKLAHLVSHPQLRREIAAAGRAHFKATLSMEAYMAKLDALHRSLGTSAPTALHVERGAS
jgi:glycosyltransferase involved in cell wall biosynthesis